MFDCVDKKSKDKNITYASYNYTINTLSDGSVLEGADLSEDIESQESPRGIEESNDTNSKCPLYCSQCIDERKCFECKVGTYYVGTEEGDHNPITCETTEPNTTIFHYKNSAYEIKVVKDGKEISSNKKREVYFNCMQGCKVCHESNTCDVCDPYNDINEKNECHKRIPNCDQYDEISNTSVVLQYEGNNWGLAYTECKVCKIGYYCVKKNEINDYKHCDYVSDINHYFNDGGCLEVCDKYFRRCYKCTGRFNCTECISEYHLSNNNVKCIKDRDPPPDNDNCTIIQKNIETELKDMNSEFFNNLAIDYNSAYYPYIKVVELYTSQKYNYSIFVFINSDCTKGLIEKGYSSVETTGIEDLLKILDEYFETNDKNDHAISIFMSYRFKNYLNLRNYEADNPPMSSPCPDCLEKILNITNNFSKIINDTFGYLVHDVIKTKKIDIFNKDVDEFTQFCKSVSLLGIDIPLVKRRNYLYPHEFNNLFLCNLYNCDSTNRTMGDLISTCKCKFSNSFVDMLSAERNDFYFYNLSMEAKKVKDAFEIFN